MTKPRLLSGDNPQIPLGYGDAVVAAWLDAVPADGPGGWKHAACRAIDAAVSAAVPGVRKAVKWNSPLYAAPDAESRDHFFLSFHCFARYVKVTFLRGDDLAPAPPEPSKVAGVRYLHVREGDPIGDRFADWVRQAAALPGVKM